MDARSAFIASALGACRLSRGQLQQLQALHQELKMLEAQGLQESERYRVLERELEGLRRALGLEGEKGQ